MQRLGEVIGGFAIATALAVAFHAHTERETMNRLWYRAIEHRVDVERELREENALLRGEVNELRDYANEINGAVHWLVRDRVRRGGPLPDLPPPMLARPSRR